MTLREYIKELQNMGEEFMDLPVAYAADDEGNAYHLLHNTPTPMEMEDPDEYFLEPVWDEENDTEGQNFNVLIVN